MKNLLTRLSRARFPYEPLIKIELSRRNLLNNLQQFINHAPNSKIAPVLKSNAYGHGLLEVGQILSNRNLPASMRDCIEFLIVDSYFEAIALRAKHINNKILIIGYTPSDTIKMARLRDTSFMVGNLETLRQLQPVANPFATNNFSAGKIVMRMPFFPKSHRIHLKLDTGMHRQGILVKEIDEAIELIKKNPYLVLEGICSHLCDADNENDSFSEEQIAIWNHSVKKFRQAFPDLKYFHLSNTDGHRFTKEIDANVSRLGIGLYGLLDNDFAKKFLLKPVLEMKTIISGKKKLEPGQSVGYGNTFKAEKEMTIAVIPVGYYEALDRRLSNMGTVLVGSNRVPCPIIGRVSMNITTIDISNVNDAEIGTEVVVISRINEDPNSILNIAKQCGIITYESTVKIPSHLKRVVMD